MEIEYTLAKDDHIAYWMYSWEQSVYAEWPLLKLLGRAGMMLTAAAFGTLWLTWVLSIVFFVVQSWAHSDAFWTFALFVWGVLFVLATLLIFCTPPLWAHTRSAHRRRVNRIVAESIRTGGIRLSRRHRVRFETSGFIEIIEFHECEGEIAIHERNETHVPWQAVKRMHLSKQLAFFFIRDKGTLILPRSAFPDEPAFLQFVDQTKELWRNAILASAPKRSERQEQLTQAPARSTAIPLSDDRGIV